jgi:hypothetical protein
MVSAFSLHKMGLDNKPNAPGRNLYLYFGVTLHSFKNSGGSLKGKKNILWETLHVVFFFFFLWVPVAYPPCMYRETKMKINLFFG